MKNSLLGDPHGVGAPVCLDARLSFQDASMDGVEAGFPEGYVGRCKVAAEGEARSHG